MEESIIETAPRTVASDVTFAAPRPCPRCGTIDRPTLAPGAGPHYARALCRHCGAFLQWLSQHSPEERRRKRQAARDDWMARKPTSPMQLTHLKALGYRGTPPQDRAAASALIDQLRQGKGGAV